MHQAGKNKNFPLRVMFELTYRCNFHCKHCYVPEDYRKYGELKTKEVFLILDQLADIGCFYLGFTGGEPFMRKDILEILWYAKKSGFEIIIYTNGSLIDQKIARQLSLLRLNKVDITIPGLSQKVFESISGVAGSRDKVFNAINSLHKENINLGFKSCVLKQNKNEISQIQKFAHSFAAAHRLDDMLMPSLDGSKEPFKCRGTLIKNLKLSDRLLAKGHMRRTLDCTTQNPYVVDAKQLPINQIANAQTLFKCGVGVNQAVITPQGELKMCLMIDSPKYEILSRKTSQRPSLEDAWKKLKEFVVSIKPDKNYACNKCKFQPYCKWCPARGWLYNKEFTACEPESRCRAQAEYKNAVLKNKLIAI